MQRYRGEICSKRRNILRHLSKENLFMIIQLYIGLKHQNLTALSQLSEYVLSKNLYHANYSQYSVSLVLKSHPLILYFSPLHFPSTPNHLQEQTHPHSNFLHNLSANTHQTAMISLSYHLIDLTQADNQSEKSLYLNPMEIV